MTKPMRWGPERSGYYDCVRGAKFVEEDAFKSKANPANDSGVEDFAEGEWAVIGADGVTAEKSGAAAADAVYPVVIGHERSDVRGAKGTTLAIGAGYWIETSGFDTANPGNYPAGTLCAVKDGILVVAASGEPIVAVVKRAPGAQQSYAEKALQQDGFTTVLVEVGPRGLAA